VSHRNDLQLVVTKKVIVVQFLENLGRRLLNGSLPLWQAFWGIFVPTPLILYLVYIAIYSIWMEWTPITLKEVELFSAAFSLVALGRNRDGPMRLGKNQLFF